MARRAISGYIAGLRHNEPVPTENTLVASLGLEFRVSPFPSHSFLIAPKTPGASDLPMKGN
jgi:hypothetical protein